jgi:hypothetical protein
MPAPFHGFQVAKVMRAVEEQWGARLAGAGGRGRRPLLVFSACGVQLDAGQRLREAGLQSGDTIQVSAC